MSYIYNTVTGRLSGGTPELRYANSPQTIEHILLGSIGESVVSYKASISLDWTLGTGHTLIETVDVDVTPNAAYPTGTAYDIVANFDTYMSAFSNAVNGRVGGVSLVYTLRGFNIDGKEQTYAVFEITGIQSPAAPGSPAPSDTRPETTINGLYAAVKLIDSAGANLPTSGNSIPITKAVIGLGNVANTLDNLAATAAPTATDDSAAGYAVGSLWIDVAHGKAYTCVDATPGVAIWTEGGGGAGNVTAAGDNTFTGANSFTQSLTVEGNLIDGLHCDDNPLDAYQAYDVDLRPYTWLDGTSESPTLTFKNYLQNLQEVTFLAKSENAESSGDAVLVAKRPDGTEVARFTVAVTPTATLRTLPFSNFSGALEITRDTTDAADTLSGAVVIYALSTWRAR